MARDPFLDELGCSFNPGQHEIIPNSLWVSSMRNRTGFNDLTLYRHRVHKSFILFIWYYPPEKDPEGVGLMCELFILPGHPDRPDTWDRRQGAPQAPGTLPTWEQIKERLKPTTALYLGMMETMRQRDYEKRRTNEDAIEERKDAVGMFRREGYQDLASGIEAGSIPWASTKDEMGQSFVRMVNGLVDTYRTRVAMGDKFDAPGPAESGIVTPPGSGD